jgi:hypothetical protein
MATEVKDGIVTAEAEVNLSTLHIALCGHSLRRDIARQRVVEAVVKGLDTEDRARLAEYEIQEAK